MEDPRLQVVPMKDDVSCRFYSFAGLCLAIVNHHDILAVLAFNYNEPTGERI